MGIEEEGNA
jgi:hypothetical protein